MGYLRFFLINVVGLLLSFLLVWIFKSTYFNFFIAVLGFILFSTLNFIYLIIDKNLRHKEQSKHQKILKLYTVLSVVVMLIAAACLVMYGGFKD